MLLRLKAWQLAGQQRALRAAVAAEQRASQDAAAGQLADWTRWRRPAPDEAQLPPPPPVPPRRLTAAAMPSAQELQAQAVRCAALPGAAPCAPWLL
jgi:hypothetical protein